MSTNFNTYIDGIVPDFWRELITREGELRFYSRGEDFFTAGKVAPYFGYIKSGTLTYVAYSEAGEGHVIGLEFSNEFVADFPFSLSGRRAKVSVVAATDCEIYCIPVSRVVELMKSDLHVKEIIDRATEAVFSTVYDRYMSLYVQTPQERYNDLISRHPDLFSLFSLRDIASFLNITPTHLSRLRKKI